MEYRTLIQENGQELLVLLAMFICLCSLLYLAIKYFFLKRRNKKLEKTIERELGNNHKVLEE